MILTYCAIEINNARARVPLSSGRKLHHLFAFSGKSSLKKTIETFLLPHDSTPLNKKHPFDNKNQHVFDLQFVWALTKKVPNKMVESVLELHALLRFWSNLFWKANVLKSLFRIFSGADNSTTHRNHPWIPVISCYMDRTLSTTLLKTFVALSITFIDTFVNPEKFNWAFVWLNYKQTGKLKSICIWGSCQLFSKIISFLQFQLDFLQGKRLTMK